MSCTRYTGVHLLGTFSYSGVVFFFCFFLLLSDSSHLSLFLNGCTPYRLSVGFFTIIPYAPLFFAGSLRKESTSSGLISGLQNLFSLFCFFLFLFLFHHLPPRLHQSSDFTILQASGFSVVLFCVVEVALRYPFPILDLHAHTFTPFPYSTGIKSSIYPITHRHTQPK